MDPLTDCPICFESYEPEPTDEEPCPEPVGRHWPVKLDCCHQSLCCHCQQCLARCPFCRIQWHPEEDVWDEGEHFWQRRRFPNPILTVWGTTLAFDAMRFVAPGVRMAVATAAATVAESSPFVLATGAAGAVAVAGGLALMKASEHRPDMAQRLRRQVSERPRRQLAPPVPESSASSSSLSSAVGKAVVRIWDALQWQLSPQWPGMPHVYTGSPWRSEARARHHQSLTALLSEAEPSSSSRDDQLVLGRRFWGDLVFLFLLWLDFNPHTPNWGSSPSYGLPPMHLCWHNRWREVGRRAEPHREDLRHVAALPEKEWSQAACLIAMLDHLLSWEVTTLDRGSSDLIQASWWKYPDFCQKLQERFAEAWAATMAPPEAEVECRSFETHAEAMAEREIPESFREMWSSI